MAWTSPMTFVSGATLTAAQMNTYVRDNMNETGPAKVTGAQQILVSTAANALASRQIIEATVATNQTETSTTYTNLSTTGPRINNLTTGTRALVIMTCLLRGNTAGIAVHASYAVTGATTSASNDSRCIFFMPASTDASARLGGVDMPTLTAGLNTFTMQYRVGGSATGLWGDRTLIIVPL